jgi:hypothetical protein
MPEEDEGDHSACYLGQQIVGVLLLHRVTETQSTAVLAAINVCV